MDLNFISKFVPSDVPKRTVSRLTNSELVNNNTATPSSKHHHHQHQQQQQQQQPSPSSTSSNSSHQSSPQFSKSTRRPLQQPNLHHPARPGEPSTTRSGPSTPNPLSSKKLQALNLCQLLLLPEFISNDGLMILLYHC